MSFLTVHELLHILDETVDDPESLSRGSPSLVLRESVQPLQDRLNVLVPEKILHKFDCNVLSKVVRQRKNTHLTAAAGVVWLPKRELRVVPP